MRNLELESEFEHATSNEIKECYKFLHLIKTEGYEEQIGLLNTFLSRYKDVDYKKDIKMLKKLFMLRHPSSSFPKLLQQDYQKIVDDIYLLAS